MRLQCVQIPVIVERVLVFTVAKTPVATLLASNERRDVIGEEWRSSLLAHSDVVRFLFTSQCVVIFVLFVMALVLVKYVRSHQRLASLTNVAMTTLSHRRTREDERKRSIEDRLSDDLTISISDLSDNVFESTHSDSIIVQVT